MTKHAVVTDDKLVFIHPDARKLSAVKLDKPITHISELWEQGQATGITHFWIMPGTQFDTAGYDSLTNRDGYSIFVPLMGTPRQEEKPRSARCWKDASGTHKVIIGYAGRYPFEWTVERPLDVLATVDYLEQVLDMPVQWSPQSIGEAYLRKLYGATERLKSYLRPMTIDAGKLPFRKAGQDVRWKRQIVPSDGWIVMYDKNSAHPSAASSMTTGAGDPVHIQGEPATIKPGVYRVSYDKQNSPFDGTRLPVIIEGEWITADVLKFARKQGYTVQIHECWQFEESHKLFTEWASDLRAMRTLLTDKESFCYEPGRVNAYWTIKDIMNRTISSLRANWWADMVGAARVAILANLDKMATEHGVYPFLVYHDDVAFICSTPDPERAIPGMLARADKMGGYKHKASIRLTPELAKQLNEIPDKESAKALTLLKRTAKKAA